MTDSFVEQAKNYFGEHSSRSSRITQFIGVPMIMFSLMIFFNFIHIAIPPLFDTTLSFLLILCLFVHYFKLEWRLAVTMLPILVMVNLLAGLVTVHGLTQGSFGLFFIFFVVGWIVQFAGQFSKGKKPALLDNLRQLMRAPLFLLADCLFALGFMKALYVDVYGVNTSEIDKRNEQRYQENTLTEEDVQGSVVNESSGGSPVVKPQKDE